MTPHTFRAIAGRAAIGFLAGLTLAGVAAHAEVTRPAPAEPTPFHMTFEDPTPEEPPQ